MSGLARAFRRASVPLAAYYAVTLALPLANGAARSGMPFAKHALVVIVVPLLAVALGAAIHAIHARCLIDQTPCRSHAWTRPRPR